ncbi:EamA family transporter RarD [Herbaspirillum sp.]|uniref:EamA family transporter RarD n=1 Tax=Herbaspirillum sp. TaxID=1890675 RepID=UPI0031D786F6
MLYAISSFLLWGLFPLYFKMLKEIPSLDIVVHRLFWSFIFLTVVLVWRRQWAWLKQAAQQPRVLLGFLFSALLLSGNWVLYVWAVNAGRIVDTSLGYFMSPLVSVVLGYLILKERMRPLQWLAVILALGAVLWLTIANGSLPWIGLIIAVTFGLYGLLRKTAQLGALEGLSLETLMLLPLVLVVLGIDTWRGSNSFVGASAGAQLLLVLSGPVTVVPLLLFAQAARRIPLSLLGLLQYISPTIQLLTGVLLYGESFAGDRAIGFSVIWLALAVYSAEGLWRLWRTRGQTA